MFFRYDNISGVTYYNTSNKVNLDYQNYSVQKVVWVPMVPVYDATRGGYYLQPFICPFNRCRDYKLQRPETPKATITITAIGKYENNWCNQLDNGDAVIFKDFLKNKGWNIAIEHYDQNVTPQDFLTAGATSDILYHSGHGGEDGTFPLYPSNKLLGWKDFYVLSRTKIFFMMTCYILGVNDWARVLRSGAHHILGYNLPSSDITDNDIIKEFLGKCYGEGGIATKKIVDAWEFVNTSYQEPWTVISHSGNRDDYMIGVAQGLTKDITGLKDIIRTTSSGTEILQLIEPTSEGISSYYEVQVEQEKLNFVDVAEGLTTGVPELKENEFFKAKTSTDGQSNVYVYPSGAIIYEGIRNRNEFKGTSDDAIKIAEQFVRMKGGGLPDDAFLAEVIPQEEQNAGSKVKKVTGYIVIFKHKIDGVEIDGISGDSIKVLVDNNGGSYMFRVWRDIKAKKLKIGKPPVDSKAAILAAEDYYHQIMKTTEPPTLQNKKIVYFSKSFKEVQTNLPLAWKITLSGRNIFVDAQTGLILSTPKS
ncbi:MAG: hypothetical protein Q8900_04735 [Bacillota bacterium]|nr:hypothetical protein [Bacillota bacterium]